MIESYQRIDENTMAQVRAFAEQFGCSVETALKFLLKTGRYPQQVGENDEAYAARLDSLPDPDVTRCPPFEPASNA
jgi:hypothetical protein